MELSTEHYIPIIIQVLILLGSAVAVIANKKLTEKQAELAQAEAKKNQAEAEKTLAETSIVQADLEQKIRDYYQETIEDLFRQREKDTATISENTKIVHKLQVELAQVRVELSQAIAQAAMMEKERDREIKELKQEIARLTSQLAQERRRRRELENDLAEAKKNSNG